MGEQRVIRLPAPGVHLPQLDGIRGLAILLVLYHHLVFYSGLRPAGPVSLVVAHTAAATWCGVDLFFVLSGFLITCMLLDAKGGGSYFRPFYARRVLRIFPLYFGTLALWFLVARPLLADAGLERPWEALGYWTFFSNVDIALRGWPASLHMAHFWSLAVEEQFYLVWPVIVFLCPPRILPRVVLGCIAAALVVRLALGWTADPLAAYVLAPARMDALAVGALLAIWAREPRMVPGLVRSARSGWLATGALLAALVLVRGGLDTLDPAVQTVGFSLLALFFGALLLSSLIAPREGRFVRTLASPVLVFLGRYSFALYVFHHPVCVALRDAGFGADSFQLVAGSPLVGVLGFALVAGAISLGLSLLSWYLWESWFLELKRFFPYRRSDSAFPASPSPSR
jgi:peptidoglycan/LPS O-acetylase OafA/YrhL